MKYELETIPIWDAYDLNGECPLCNLKERAEKEYLDFFLGNSVMIPEMRIKVNAVGFCPDHFERLFRSRKNRHGLGLVTHTHLKTQMEQLEKQQKALLKTFGKQPQGAPEVEEVPDQGKGNKGKKQLVRKYREQLEQLSTDCMICERVDYTLKRYAYTIVYLWKKNLEFYDRYNESKGFCLTHLPLMLTMAEEQLSRRQFAKWLTETIALQQKALDRLEGEILWYTQKYDFQNDGKPWGTSKDALERTIQKFTGVIPKEPE